MNTLKVSTITVLYIISKFNLDELRLLSLVAKKMTVHEIAELQNNDESIVETQIQSLIDKFEFPSLSHLVAVLSEINLSSLFMQL